MKAPIYAYVVGEDNNFLKVVTRDSSGVYRSFVARFLRGSRAEGGYSESSADMIDDIKALFRLDDLLLVRQKQSDGGMKVMGFVGMVRTDGPWAEYHNMNKRSAGVASGRDGRTYVYLNDAGLNILPHVVLEAVATWANWTRIKVSTYGGFYDGVKTGTFSSDVMGLTGTLPSSLPDTEKVTYFDFQDPTPESVEVDSGGDVVIPDFGSHGPGQNYTAQASATNDEGTCPVRSISFVSGARVKNPRVYFMYSEDEPVYVSDLSGDVGADFYEEEWMLMCAFTAGTVSGAGVRMFAQPGGGAPPTLTSYVPAGWYFNTMFEPLCFHVNSSGIVDEARTLLRETPPTVSVSLRIGGDRTASTDHPRYALIWEASTNYEWVSRDAIRITIKGSASASPASLRTGIGLHATQDGSYVDFDSNLTASDTETVLVLTKSGVTDVSAVTSRVLRGIYPSESAMYADPSAVDGKWLDKDSRGSGNYSSVRQNAVTVQWRSALTKQWEDPGTFFTLSLAVSEIDLSYTP